VREVNLDIRIVLYRESDSWVAHCLEFDLIGSGDTQPEALECLAEAIALQLEDSISHNNPRNLFQPADSEIFHRYAVGANLGDSSTVLAKLRIQHDPVTIPGVEAREYLEESPDDLAMV